MMCMRLQDLGSCKICKIMISLLRTDCLMVLDGAETLGAASEGAQ